MSKKNNGNSMREKVYDISEDESSSIESDSDTEKYFNEFNCSSETDSETDSDTDSDTDTDSESSNEDSSDSSSEPYVAKSRHSTKSKTKHVKKYPNPNKKVLKSNDIFKELIKKQLKNIPSQWKLNINDMKRICKYIDTSIFDPSECCIWKGYITNANNSNKGTYVNFYFKNKKVALHRLLYSNFVAPLDSSEYLKFNCDNKGVCCNVNHYEKYKYSKGNGGGAIKKEKNNNERKKESKEIIIIGTDESDKLIIDFD